jgi:flagellar M-ring protein FliF
MSSTDSSVGGSVKDRAQAMGQKVWGDFRAFTPGQKAVTIAAAVALIVGGYLFSTWASKPTYSPLFTNLAASDASAIVDKLQADHKQYKLSEGGTAILVPEKDVYALRLTMSSAGLPSSGQTGYSLLDKEGITTSEFKQRIDYQRALEGELASTINSIDGVEGAQVHLALPAQDVFSDDTKETTAAVLITTTPGLDLTNDQVRSIVNLVSSSVPALTADQVTVSDATGKVLAAAGSGVTAGGGTSSQNEATQTYDNQQAAAVQKMLDRVLGPGRAVVTVNAVLDFDSATTNSRTYSYDKDVPPLSQSTTSESYGNGASPTGGVLGSNTTAASAAATTAASATAASTAAPSSGTAAAGSGSYSKTSDTRDNSVNTVDLTRVSAPGAVKQLGVSVVMDEAAAKNVDTATIKEQVASAVSLDTKRGDTLAVATMPFDTSTAEAAAKAAADAKKQAASAASSKRLMSIVKTGGVVLAVIIAVVLTIVMSRRRRAPGADFEPRDQAPDDLEALLDALNERAAGQEGIPREPAMRRPTSAADSEQTIAQRRAVGELADEQPDDMARLLRSWLNSTEG